MADKLRKELRLERHDAAEFLRELAESIEDEDEVMIQGDGWKIYQPYEDIIPFRIIQNDSGLEVDLKMVPPEDETEE
ncbi:MAG: hypothetical protein ABEJ66_01440 [Candidatus Nanohaloarchaea archaeon]